MRELATTGRRAAVRIAAAVVVVLGLAGCGDAGLLSPPPAPSGSAQPTGGATGPTAESTEGGGETAAPEDAELEAFRGALEGQGVADPAALVAAIEAAGFDRASIERTREVDSLGAPVSFMEVAVRLEGSCLVGQVGEDAPSAIRMGQLGGGRCLIGDVVAP